MLQYRETVLTTLTEVDNQLTKLDLLFFFLEPKNIYLKTKTMYFYENKDTFCTMSSLFHSF